jgi:hypothetical protein
MCAVPDSCAKEQSLEALILLRPEEKSFDGSAEPKKSATINRTILLKNIE